MRICKATLNEQTTSIATYSTREFNSNRNASLDASILAKLHNFLRWNIRFRDIHSYKLHLQYSKVSAMIPPHPRYHNRFPWDEHLGCWTVTYVFHLGLKFIFQRNLCRLHWRIPNLLIKRIKGTFPAGFLTSFVKSFKKQLMDSSLKQRFCGPFAAKERPCVTPCKIGSYRHPPGHCSHPSSSGDLLKGKKGWQEASFPCFWRTFGWLYLYITHISLWNGCGLGAL